MCIRDSHKGVYIFERTVDGCEAHIGNFIKIFKSFHYHFAYAYGCDLLLQGVENLSRNIVHECVLLRCRYGALFACLANTGKDLFTVERLARSVTFYNGNRNIFDFFISCEALTAIGAFAATTYCCCLLYTSRCV